MLSHTGNMPCMLTGTEGPSYHRRSNVLWNPSPPDRLNVESSGKLLLPFLDKHLFFSGHPTVTEAGP